MNKWNNLQMGYVSKNGDIGQSGYRWDSTDERILTDPPPPPHLPHTNFLRRRRGASRRRSAPRLILSWGITDMGEEEALYKSERELDIVCVRDRD